MRILCQTVPARPQFPAWYTIQHCSNHINIILTAVILSIFFFANTGIAQTYPPGHPLWGTVVIPDSSPPPSRQETTIHIHNYHSQKKARSSRGYNLPKGWRERRQKRIEERQRKRAQIKKEIDASMAKYRKEKAARKAREAQKVKESEENE